MTFTILYTQPTFCLHIKREKACYIKCVISHHCLIYLFILFFIWMNYAFKNCSIKIITTIFVLMNIKTRTYLFCFFFFFKEITPWSWQNGHYGTCTWGRSGRCGADGTSESSKFLCMLLVVLSVFWKLQIIILIFMCSLAYLMLLLQCQPQ